MVASTPNTQAHDGLAALASRFVSVDDLPWVAQHDDWHGLSDIGRSFASRKWCWDRYIELSEATVGIQGKWMQRHAIAFTKGLPGARKVRTLMHDQDSAKAMANAISGFLASD